MTEQANSTIRDDFASHTPIAELISAWSGHTFIGLHEVGTFMKGAKKRFDTNVETAQEMARKTKPLGISLGLSKGLSSLGGRKSTHADLHGAQYAVGACFESLSRMCDVHTGPTARQKASRDFHGLFREASVLVRPLDEETGERLRNALSGIRHSADFVRGCSCAYEALSKVPGGQVATSDLRKAGQRWHGICNDSDGFEKPDQFQNLSDEFVIPIHDGATTQPASSGYSQAPSRRRDSFDSQSPTVCGD